MLRVLITFETAFDMVLTFVWMVRRGPVLALLVRAALEYPEPPARRRRPLCYRFGVGAAGPNGGTP